jgi:hypothetical protein
MNVSDADATLAFLRRLYERRAGRVEPLAFGIAIATDEQLIELDRRVEQPVPTRYFGVRVGGDRSHTRRSPSTETSRRLKTSRPTSRIADAGMRAPWSSVRFVGKPALADLVPGFRSTKRLPRKQAL